MSRMFAAPSTTSLRDGRTAEREASIRDEEFASRPDAYGVFPWWPADDALWLHPYDRPLAEDCLPGDRVWRRHRGEGDFDLVCHGGIRFRARCAMWLEVPPARFWIGDRVEVRSEYGVRMPFFARVAEVRWDRRRRRHRYLLERPGRMALSLHDETELIRRRPLADGSDVRIEPTMTDEPEPPLAPDA